MASLDKTKRVLRNIEVTGSLDLNERLIAWLVILDCAVEEQNLSSVQYG